jgi:hypothetical protein
MINLPHARVMFQAKRHDLFTDLKKRAGVLAWYLVSKFFLKNRAALPLPVRTSKLLGSGEGVRL